MCTVVCCAVIGCGRVFDRMSLCVCVCVCLCVCDSLCACDRSHCVLQYHAMVHIMDEVVGNITDAFKAKSGMWENVRTPQNTTHRTQAQTMLHCKTGLQYHIAAIM